MVASALVPEAAPAVATGPAPRDDPPIAISWIAPAACPGLEALKSEVRSLAGAAPAPAERLEAEATVRPGPGNTWQLTLRTRTGARVGERKLAGADCAEVMRAAALVLALMINPAAAAPAEPPPPPVAPPVVVAPVEPAASPAPLERRFGAGADLLLGTGALPGVGPGVGLRFVAARGGISAELRGSIWMGQSTSSPSDPAAGGSFDLVDVAAAGCVRARREHRVSPGACVGGVVARMHATGFGVSDPGAAAAWWTAAFVEGNVRLRLTPRNAVRIGAQGLVSLGRPAFALAGVGPVFQPASIWLRGMLGWELIF